MAIEASLPGHSSIDFRKVFFVQQCYSDSMTFYVIHFQSCLRDHYMSSRNRIDYFRKPKVIQKKEKKFSFNKLYLLHANKHF